LRLEQSDGQARGVDQAAVPLWLSLGFKVAPSARSPAARRASQGDSLLLPSRGRRGMDDALLKIMVPVVLAGLAGLSLLGSLVFNVSGTWERVPEGDVPPGTRPERLTLGQFGPFVRGRRDVPGGWQEYAGLMWGPRLKLTRRDFGVEALKRQNFPDVLAAKLNGDIFAELKLTLTDGGVTLQGTFTPQKIDFLLAPPRITQRYWMPAVGRAYRRVSAVELEEDKRGRLDVGVKNGEPA